MIKTSPTETLGIIKCYKGGTTSLGIRIKDVKRSKKISVANNSILVLQRMYP